MAKRPSNTPPVLLSDTLKRTLITSSTPVHGLKLGGEMTSITGGANEKRSGGITRREGTKLLVCKNNSSGRADLSIGFVKGDGIDQRFEPTLVWTGVGYVFVDISPQVITHLSKAFSAKLNITAQFTPVLRAYVTRDYQASQLLRGEVETDTIWEQNINELNDVTGWNF
ncbi:hypothetical protein FRC12_000571 [Ceratobasidium sp. 428]|nr:hypothetical protein FRC12_000571 [Ceratobasidium sp. 428]